MSQPAAQQRPPDHPPSAEELNELLHDAVDRLNHLADRLESFAGTRSPRARTRRDDEGVFFL